MYANITNPANFQLQDFAQFGFRVITTDFIPVPGEQYRTLYVLQDAVVTATTQKGDDITSKAILAGTLLHGLFNSVSITSGRVLAYAAGRVTAEEIIALYEAYVVALGGTLENTQCAIDTINEEGVDLFADASLVMIPEGYATGVVYGQRPLTSDSQLAFTRASTATRVGPDGLIQKVRTNLLLQSNSFDTGWSLTSGSSVTSGQSGYDGSSDAWLLNDSGNSSAYCIYRSYTNTGVETFSIYAKQASTSQIEFDFFGGSNGYLRVNLTDGSLHSTINTIDYNIEDAGSGWWRCSFSANNTSAPTLVRIGCDGAGAIYIQDAQIETGDIATDYIPTTTTAVSVGPVANVPRIDYTGGGCGKLLLEPQTTALNQFSESFDNAYWQLKTDVTIEANTTDTLDPAGYYGAEKITETATTARHRLASNGTTSSTVNHTASVFMKKGTARYGFVTYAAGTIYTIIVDLEDGTITQTSTSGTIVAQKVEDYGNGWYRISVTGLSGISGSTQYALQFGSAGSAVPSSYVSNIPSFTGSTSNYLYAWGANLTATSYLQSYIPTTAAAVTRLADACSKTGISSLIGQTQGTLFLDFIYKPVFDTTQTSYRASISDGTYTGRVSILAENSNTLSVVITGVSLTGSTFPIVDGQRYKVAIGYGATTDVYINGAKVYSYSSGTPTGTYTRFQFSDATGLASRAFAGPINQALLFKTRLTNEQLQTLTSL